MSYGRDDYEKYLRRREEWEGRNSKPYVQRGMPFRELQNGLELFPSPSGLIWICFIGGPLHLTEKVYPNKEFKTTRHRFMMQTFGPISPTMQDFTLGDPMPIETATYVLGAAPETLTEKFAPHPLVIALFDSA